MRRSRSWFRLYLYLLYIYLLAKGFWPLNIYMREGYTLDGPAGSRSAEPTNISQYPRTGRNKFCWLRHSDGTSGLSGAARPSRRWQRPALFSKQTTETVFGRAIHFVCFCLNFHKGKSTISARRFGSIPLARRQSPLRSCINMSESLLAQ